MRPCPRASRRDALTLASNLRVPELVPGVDVRSLPLSALEGFVLSRIDGKSTMSDVVALTGLPADQVATIFDKLLALKAVRFRGDSQAANGDPDTKTHGRGTGLTGSPTRKRTISHTPPAHQRRLFSESGVSSPPPKMPANSTRPRALAESGAPTRTHSVLPASGSEPPRNAPAPGATARGPSERPSPMPKREDPTPSPAPERRSDSAPRSVLTAAMPPAAQASIAPSMVPEPVIYDRAELEEDVDLPLDRRKQVLELYYRRLDLDFYEALGVPYNADKKQIRSAYFALSKVFHPDSMFRKNLGSFKPKMEALFQLLTEAYETLGKKKAREEYDAYLRATKAARMAERALLFDAAETGAPAGERIEVPPAPIVPHIVGPSSGEVEPSPLEPPASPPSAPAPPREASPEARRLAQEVIGRRLRGLTRIPGAMERPQTPVSVEGPQRSGESTAAQAPPPQSAQPKPKTDAQDVLRRLTQTLRDVGQLTGSTDRVTRALRASQAALERGDLNEATQQAARAASLAPERPELKAEHAKLSAQLSEKLANNYIEQAKFEMKHGKWASAALTWTKVCEGRPNDAGAHRHAAQALLKAGGDLRGAQKYAQKAAFLAPNDIEGRILLAQIYLTVGLKLNARRELEAAAKLDPKNEMVKNLIADLDKS